MPTALRLPRSSDLHRAALLGTALLWGLPAAISSAQDADPTIKLADGKITLRAPDKWVRKTPRVRIIEYEFSVPAEAGDTQDGRVTIMGAGGAIEQNIDRWLGQFTQPDHRETRQVANIEKLQIAGQEVHLIDVAGTYHDAPPFVAGGTGGARGKPLLRENYRMLAAIIVTDAGRYYVKFYGPKATVSAQADAFRKLLDSLSVK